MKETHRYGGPWTQVKIDALQKYLSAYTTALKNTGFHLIYVDGFAGTGYRNVKQEQDLLNAEAEIAFAGSAAVALNTTPAFDRFVFVEEKRNRIAALESLRAEHSDKNIVIREDDANEVVRELCATTNWREGKGIRAVLFLDPYGLSVEWNTLVAVANTKAIDLWYLFSISGLYRQAARNIEKVNEEKAAAIDRVLGTNEWREAFYKPPKQGVLFGTGATGERTANVAALERFVKARLESIFPAVAVPLPLPKSGTQLFSLFFAVSNPARKAIGPAMRIAEHILRTV